jgi:hypothetical protein
MSSIIEIINEEIMTTVANYPQFGDRLKSIDEIGDGSSQSYPFRFDNVGFNEVHYNFDTEDGDDYIVYLTNSSPEKRIWEMQFGVAGGTPEDVINKGRVFKIMATLLAVINDFIEKLQPNLLRFEPSKNNEDDNRRFKMYMAYINKNMRKEYYAYDRNPYIVIERKIKLPSDIK